MPNTACKENHTERRLALSLPRKVAPPRTRSAGKHRINTKHAQRTPSPRLHALPNTQAPPHCLIAAARAVWPPPENTIGRARQRCTTEKQSNLTQRAWHTQLPDTVLKCPSARARRGARQARRRPGAHARRSSAGRSSIRRVALRGHEPPLLHTPHHCACWCAYPPGACPPGGLGLGPKKKTEPASELWPQALSPARPPAAAASAAAGPRRRQAARAGRPARGAAGTARPAAPRPRARRHRSSSFPGRGSRGRPAAHWRVSSQTRGCPG